MRPSPSMYALFHRRQLLTSLLPELAHQLLFGNEFLAHVLAEQATILHQQQRGRVDHRVGGVGTSVASQSSA